MELHELMGFNVETLPIDRESLAALIDAGNGLSRVLIDVTLTGLHLATRGRRLRCIRTEADKQTRQQGELH